MTEGHDIFAEDTGAYVLGALTDIERRRFERHLAECHVCSNEVERLRPAASALPRSVTPVAAPPSLKAALMAEVEADAARGAEARTRPARRSVRERMAGALDGLAGMRPAVAWMSACFVLAVGVLAGYAATRIADEEAGPRTVAAKVDKQRIPFGSGSLLVPDQPEDGAILRVHGMPTLRSNSVYQVWVKRDDEVISQSLFSVGANGDGAAAVLKDLDGADAVLVTREPAGGARAPSERPVMEVRL